MRLLLTIFLLLGYTLTIDAQSVAVLPGNGSNDQNSAPQTGAKFQRQFYLITPAEMQRAGFQNGMPINSIGFTNAVAPTDTTRGQFKVYLQNTADTKSRLDTSWTEVTTSANVYQLNGLMKGSYEWQVLACNGSSMDTARSFFANNNLTACNAPTNLTTDNITTSSATFHWVAPASVGATSYVVEYAAVDSVEIWVTDTVTTTSKTVTGLAAGKHYQWRVRTICASNVSSLVKMPFTTEPAAAACNNPSGLTVTAIGSDSAKISWTAAVGATYYNIQYRRIGTSGWTSRMAFSNSGVIKGLTQGTTYEWRIATACTLGTGAYIAGSNFTTTGITTCYAPEGLSANALTDSSATLSWTGNSSAPYKIRYRLREFINWATVDTMTLVHNDSIAIPNTVGAYDVPFANGAPFTYTGGGVYVAFEYSNATATANLNTCLSTHGEKVLKNAAGIDSVRYVLSLGAIKSDTLPGVLTASSFRPETRFGSPDINDKGEVAVVYALGKYAIPFGQPAPVSALIKNHTDSTQDFTATLVIKDVATNTIKYGPVNQAVTINAQSQSTVTFPGWAPNTNERDSLIVTVNPLPNENFLLNNRNFYLQNNNQYQMGFADESQVLSQTGFDTLSGLILAKYNMSGCSRIGGAEVYLGNSAKGHAVYAVALDTAGHIIATSDALTPDSTQVNRYHSFSFTDAPLLRNVDYYVGLSQNTSSQGNGFFPVGVQWEGGAARSGAYYRAKLNGDSITVYANVGRLMINANLLPDTLMPIISGNLTLCQGTTNTLTASGINRRWAESVVAFSSQASADAYSAAKVLGSPDVYPDYGINSNAWAGSSPDGRREFLTLHFANPAPINVVEIYETMNPGAVDSIFAKNPATGNYELLYSTTAVAKPAVARINRINFPTTTFNVSEIRIAIASNTVSGINSIDAVAIGNQYNAPGFTSYVWTPGGETSNTKLVTTAGGYKVTVTNAAGCSASDSVYVNTPILTAPVITAGGATTFCMGDSVKLKSNKVGGNTWSTGANTDSIYVKTGGTYTLTHNDGSGCGTTSATIAITVNALPNASISGQPAFCQGASTTLMALPAGGTYVWSNGGTSNTNVVSTADVFSVKVTDANGCKATASITTLVSPMPQPHITGQLSYCPGASATIDAGSGYASYAWSNGATGSLVTVSTPGNYSVTVTDAIGCSGTDSATIVQNVAPTPYITGGLSLCAGSTTLNAGGGYSGYAWSTGATTATISVSQVATYSVTVTDYNGCTGSASATTNSESLPATPGPIGGSLNGLCNATGGTFSISPVSNATHYVWTVSPGATIVSGQGTTTVVIAVSSSFTSGTLTVAASNPCGQSGSLNPRVLNINSKPADPVSISGNISNLCSLTGQVYSTPVIASASSYTWTVPAGATITSGAGTNTITVNFTNSFTSGSICVRANNACGSSAYKCITVSGMPLNPGAISGANTVCFNQDNVLYTVAPQPGTVNYVWTVPQRATITSGQGTNSIRVRFGNKSGNVTVTATNACGSSTQQSLSVATSNCVSGFSAAMPEEQRLEPSVIGNAGGTDATAHLQLEWTLGEPIIESVVNNNRLYTQGFHQPIIVVKEKAQELSYTGYLHITVAPNPVRDHLTVRFESKNEEDLLIYLQDALGRTLLVRPIKGKTGQTDINMMNLRNGTYLINVRSKAGKYNQSFKVVKIG